ncbi:MAG: GyrI-like domain-containing protein, partial [Spirochaetaceae bacterium]|nr:GyrI-like domain-containing protein [Spirochaetaceae bacterium]
EVAVPAATWAIFPCKGPIPESIQSTWPRIMGEWFPESGYERADGPDLEIYLDKDISQPDYKSEIWVPVRKA